MPVRADAASGLSDERYRDAAERLFGNAVTFDKHAHVQRVADGAFVEGHVWVPKAEAEKETEP